MELFMLLVLLFVGIATYSGVSAGILLTIALLLVGLILIVRGGDIFVDAATWMAEASGIPKFIIGATVVSFATTLPELLTSAFGTAAGSYELAIGNAVGSVTANIGLILAISLLACPLVIRRMDYAVKTGLMLGAAVVIVIFGAKGSFGIVPSIILIVMFLVNMAENIWTAKKKMTENKDESKNGEEKVPTDKKTILTNIGKFVLGAGCIVVGAKLLVNNGQDLALACGVSERVIGVTLIAIGTSLPELVTTITAIIKKQNDLSVGNILGANIIDLSLILPICSFIAGGNLVVNQNMAMIDLPACLVIGCVATIPAIITKKFHRWQGIAIGVLYIAYIVISCVLIQG